MRSHVTLGLAAAALTSACNGSPAAPASEPEPRATTFEEDVAFLRQYGLVQVLERPGGGRIAISAKYQARVMTSAVAPGARSLGFINRAFIAAGKTGTQFDNYGGEDRFWLGPEGGQFGLYFPPGAPFDLAHWQTPEALQRGAWTIRESGPLDVLFQYPVDVKNWSGTELHAIVHRDVRLLEAQDVKTDLAIDDIADGLQWVAFESVNELENYGQEWTESTGLLSVWILGMYNPAPDARVIIPFEKNGQGAVVNDRYFGKVPDDRLRVDMKDGYLVFAADGHHRSKIGLGPSRARSVLGSYSPSAKLLTIVQYNKPEGATDYVNSMWEKQDAPLAGDVVNSYNDGPLEPGKPSLGGFYELETSSPAAALPTKGTIRHVHRTFHFVGDTNLLDAIARRVLGVPLAATGVSPERG